MFGIPPTATGWFGTGVLLVAIGALIKYRGWTFLLAGYDETAAIPDDVVANVAGNTVLRIGIVALVVGVIYVVTSPPSYFWLLVTGVIVIDTARLVYRVNTYTPSAAG
jgi:hypothetical protein